MFPSSGPLINMVEACSYKKTITRSSRRNCFLSKSLRVLIPTDKPAYIQ